MPRAVVVGEALVDLIQPSAESRELRMVLGGSPYNVAVGARRFGPDVAFVGAVGADVPGGMLLRFLDEVGVDHRHVTTRQGQRTYLALATMDAGHPTYAFYGDALRPTADEVDHDVLRDADVLYVGSAMFGTAASRALTADLCRSAPGLVAIDPNIRDVWIDDVDALRTDIDALLPDCDIVKMSDEDAAFLYPGRPASDVAAHVRSLGPPLVVVTLGAEGSLARTGAGEVRVPANTSLPLSDTTGAGDSFMAALVARAAADGDLGAMIDEIRDVLRVAAGFAGIVCSRPGGAEAAPTMAELLDQHPWAGDLSWLQARD